MRSTGWVGDEPVNQAWGRTTVTVEPWYPALQCHWHTGIDIGGPGCKGKPLFALRAGKVCALSPGILGLAIPGGQVDYYVHGSYVVKLNQEVARGQKVGAFDNVVPVGGASFGPHLHFEVQPAGGRLNVPTGLNPIPILEAQGDSDMLFLLGPDGASIFVVDVSGKRHIGRLEYNHWIAQAGSEPALKVQKATAADLLSIPDIAAGSAPVDITKIVAAIADLRTHPAAVSDPTLKAAIDALGKHLGVGSA